MGRKITHKEFVEKIKAKNPSIEIMSEYINTKTKIKCKCLIDGYEWDVSAHHLLEGRGCRICGGRATREKIGKTHEQFIREMKNINGDIEILGKYINNYTKLECRCKLDGHVWNVIPTSLLSGTGCPQCVGITMWDTDKFILEMKQINANIKILSEYENGATKVKCKCLLDGYEWEASPKHLLLGTGCQQCNINKKTKSNEEFKKELINKNLNVEALELYKGVSTKIRFKCNKGHEWLARPNDVLKGHGCPRCKASRGEKMIKKYLKQNSISFKAQYKTEKCKSTRILAFDFAILDQNKLIALIEYQGAQHYKAVDFAGKGEEWANKNLKYTQKNDKIKRDYCLLNNIPLIEIPYWVKDVEGYLEKRLNSLNRPLQLSIL